MNKIFRLQSPLRYLLALLFVLATGRATAQIAAYDDASAYNTWTNSMNEGYGFLPWVLTQNNGNGNNAGFFIGGSGGIDVSNQSFGLYANVTDITTDDAYAIAYRGFSNALASSGQVFKFKFQNTAIASGGFMGFCLRSDNNTNFTDAGTDIIADGGTRFALYFAGGYDDYYIYDGRGPGQDTGIGFTGAGLSLEFYLLDADHYLLLVKSADGTSTIASFSNTLAGGGAGGEQIITFAGFNEATAAFQDAYFNSFEIESVSLLPPQISNVVPNNGTNFWPAANGLSFDVSSVFSTINTSQTTLTLNGALQTLNFSGSPSNEVATLASPLITNALYNAVIVATDANGNHTTNNFSFNTWQTSPNNIYIESGDYNISTNGLFGLWIDNLLVPQPNQAYAGFHGSNTYDYLKYDTTGTNHPNQFRIGDLPAIRNATDIDHDNFASDGFQDYDLEYNQNGEWVDYTRHLQSGTYAVYARMAGFPPQGGSTTMLMERAATAQVSSTNQPRAAMGTFVCPSTGGVEEFAFIPLTDFFSNPVLIRLPGTNTFRLTNIGPDGSYNFNYLLLVANTNTAVLHPYIASGYPFPNATGVAPDQILSFTIANQAANVVNTGSIKVLLNSMDITSGSSISNNAAGATVSYTAPDFLTPGANTLQVSFSDGLVSQTNQWSFDVITLPAIPTAYAVQLNGNYSPGFAQKIAKAPDNSTNIDFPNTVARTLAQLAGTLTNSLTGQPYVNLAPGPNGDGTYIESNTVNYDITGNPSGSFTFVTKTNFPYVPAAATNNYIAMSDDVYVQLAEGIYTFAVRSDDGFELTTGPTPTSTNMILGIFDNPNGRSDQTPTEFSFIVNESGLYPMQLLYNQGQFGGNIEFYSVNRTNGVPTLINDPATPGSIKVYHLASGVVTPIPLTIQRQGTNAVLSWSGPSYLLQSATAVTGPYSTIVNATSPYTNGMSGTAKFYRLSH